MVYMEKELLQRIALEQREYWNNVAKEAGDRSISQAPKSGASLGDIDPSAVTPADWMHYWNRFVEPDKSF